MKCPESIEVYTCPQATKRSAQVQIKCSRVGPHKRHCNDKAPFHLRVVWKT